MNNALLVASHTLLDQLQRRGFFALGAVSILLVLSLRGCYEASFTVNGEQVSGVSVAWHASLIAFHCIVAGMMLVAVLMAGPLLPADERDGTMVMYLARPVSRAQYVLGRLGGLWLLLSGLMLVLHATVFLIAWQKTGGIIPGYLAASLLCSLSLLFVIVLTALFSLFLPGFITAVTSLAVIGVGFLSDGGYQLLHSQTFGAVFHTARLIQPALWRQLYPKLLMVQQYAATLVGKEEFHGLGPVHPLVNVLIYCLLFLWLLLAAFERKEV